ncbi:MAG: hypothetical protein WCW26_00505 [Candidatus Buchananbacteria bacterium]
MVKNVLSAAAVPIFGFILLNFTFIFNAIFQGIIRGLFRLFAPLEPNMDIYWFPPSTRILFAAIILLISWFIFRSKLKVIYKAIYLVVPITVILVTAGIFLYHWPIISYSFGGLFCAGILYYLYRTKQSWLYYYTVLLVGLVLLIFNLLGGEI